MTPIKWMLKKNIDFEQTNLKLNECIENRQFSNFGKNTIALQNKLKNILNIDDDKIVIVTTSGTSALYALVSLYNKINNKKLKFITQSFTFPCSHQNLLYDSIIVDIDENMGPSEQKLMLYLNEYDGIIVTNCFGYCVNMTFYLNFCEKYNKILLFDNATCPLTYYNGKNILNFGNGSMISLHHTKQLGFGEGGAIIIDKKYEKDMNKIISFGKWGDVHFEYDIYSSNFKMSEISAIYIDQWLNNYSIIKIHNNKIMKYFTDKMNQTFLGKYMTLFPNFSDESSLLACIPIIFKYPVNEYYFLKFNVEAKKYYYPLDKTCKNSMRIYDTIICLPLHMDITECDIDKYINILAFYDCFCEKCDNYFNCADYKELNKDLYFDNDNEYLNHWETFGIKQMRLCNKKQLDIFDEFGIEVFFYTGYYYYLFINGLLFDNKIITYIGMRSFYYFLNDDQIIEKNNPKRRWINPKENSMLHVLGHDGNYYFDERYCIFPNYKEHFQNNYFQNTKKILIIHNKYTMERRNKKLGFHNNISMKTLSTLFNMLSTNYQIIYLEPQSNEKIKYSCDEYESFVNYSKFELIKHNHPSVIKFDDLFLLEKFSNMSYNELKLYLYASCDNYISVQGGGNNMISYFAKTMLVYHIVGTEIARNIYTHRSQQQCISNDLKIYVAQSYDELKKMAYEIF